MRHSYKLIERLLPTLCNAIKKSFEIILRVCFKANLSDAEVY